MKPMQISIQSREDNYIRFQIKEDPHTMFNLLRVLALQEEGVVLAGYARDRTFEDSLMFQIRTEDGIDPVETIINATRKIIEMAESFKTKFDDEYAV